MLGDIFLNNYFRAFMLFVGLSVLFRVVLFVFEKIILFFTMKTKTKLDDILIEKLSIPLLWLSILVALVPSIQILSLEETIRLILSNIVYSIIVFIFARIIYLVVNILVFTGLKSVAKKSKIKLDDTLFHMFRSLLNVILIILSLLYLLSLWGVEIGPLLAGLGIAGLAVALALQPILSNIFSGAAIIIDGSIKVGDVVYLEGESIKGVVDKIGLRATRIRTFDNEYIIVPNNKVADAPIQNIVLPEPKSRVVIPFGVAYGTDIKKVKKIVSAEIKKVNDIDKSEEVIVRFIEMADSSLNFKVFFYVTSYSYRFDAIDEANTRIYNALNEAKIEIPFPQMDVNLKKR